MSDDIVSPAFRTTDGGSQDDAGAPIDDVEPGDLASEASLPEPGPADALDAETSDSTPGGADPSPEAGDVDGGGADPEPSEPEGPCVEDEDCEASLGPPPHCTVFACLSKSCQVVADPGQDGGECDDGYACSFGTTCSGGVCGGGVLLDCSPLGDGACNPGVCDPVDACVVVVAKDGTACDDGDACTANDRCSKGTCGGTPKECDDGDPCDGVETCAAGAGCTPGSPLACDDGNPCNGVETCDPDEGCLSGSAPACDDGNVCNGQETCLPASGCAAGTPLSCDDGNACNGVEQCHGALGCLAGIPPPCDDGDACNGAEGCDPKSGCVSAAPLACDDEDACNGLESCLPASGCAAGTPLACDDGNACNGVESCAAAAGCTPGTPPACDDGDPCDGTETCDPASGCEPGAVPDCGLFACGPAGCAASCSGAGQCKPQAFCDAADLDGDGDADECLADVPDGGACKSAAGFECASGHCANGHCCASGICCAADADCPTSGVVPGPAQPSESPLAFAEVSPSDWGAQSFVPDVPGELVSVELSFFGTPGKPVPVTLRLHAAALPGEPGSVLLASETFDVAEQALHVVAFSPPPKLAAGAVYWLVATGEGFPTSCDPDCPPEFVLWYGSGALDPYPAGTPYFSENGGASWFTFPNAGDRRFATKVTVHGCLASKSCAAP